MSLNAYADFSIDTAFHVVIDEILHEFSMYDLIWLVGGLVCLQRNTSELRSAQHEHDHCMVLRVKLQQHISIPQGSYRKVR